jgi:hypothetical protein
MPYHRVVESEGAVDSNLVAALVQELRRTPIDDVRPTAATLTPVEAPEIIEEQTPRGPVHVTVVWDKWPHLSGEARGRIILEAYRQAQGDDAMRRISIALGVTSQQAERLGLFRN